MQTIKVYSFDIFDTLISRVVADPAAIWSFMSVKLAAEESADYPAGLLIDFKRLRREAENRSTETSAGKEARMDDIYKTLGQMCPELSERQIQRLLELELDLEQRSIYGIPANVRRALELLDQGKRVILTSDMYLPASAIRNMLREAEPRLAELDIYLSSEQEAGKSDGAIFGIICRKEGVNPEQIYHIGDNFFSDYYIPKRLRIQSEFYEASQLTELERSYATNCFGLLPCVVAGLSKRLRLSQERSSRAYELGACFTGAFFYGFVHHTLTDTRVGAPEAFYFLARDGYVLYRIAQRICETLGLERDLRYLYISRQAVYLASIHHIQSNSIDKVFDGLDPAPTPNHVAESLQVATDVITRHLPEGASGVAPLSQTELEQLKAALLKSREASEAILEAASKARSRLLSYLGQEGFFQFTRVGLVDVGWAATIQDALYSALLYAQSKVALHGYYYGCNKVSEQTTGCNSKSAYFVKPEKHQEILKIIEVITVANHGRTLDYRESSDGRVEPVLKESFQIPPNFDVDDYFRGIDDFTIKLSEFVAGFPHLQTDFMAIDGCLFQRLKEGDRFVADSLGDVCFASNAYENARIPVAARFTVGMALRSIFSSSAKRKQMTHWMRGTQARSSLAARLILALDIRQIIKRTAHEVTHRRNIREQFRRYRKMLPFRLKIRPIEEDPS